MVWDGMKTGPRGGSKSVGFGGASLYRIGESTASSFLTLPGPLVSGVDRPLDSGASEPPLDSRFFRVSFFARDARSRARGASSCVFGLKSGLRGEETVGWWSSSKPRF
jgi:hypothetical protein